MDLSVRPQDDFFRYVNGKWLDNTPIPADLSAYGSFAILRERSPGQRARDHRGRGPLAGGAGIEQPEGRRSL